MNFDDLLNSVDGFDNDDEPLPDFVYVPCVRGLEQIDSILNLLRGVNAFICGGYARYCVSPNEGRRLVKAGDVDIYCHDEETFDYLYQHFKANELEIRFDTDVALTYKKTKDKDSLYYGCPVIQLIKPIDQGAIVASGDMETILRNFDFTVIRCGIVEMDDGYYALVDVDFMEDEGKKRLRIKNIHCPISSLLRFMKYGSKGYKARPSQIAKLFADWDARSDDYRVRLMNLFQEGGELGELSPAEIDELESLLRID